MSLKIQYKADNQKPLCGSSYQFYFNHFYSIKNNILQNLLQFV